eukprot:TRINITY_DN65491_c0_g1_i2.p1 TRINITY_DN65491_c0_g1~~TRINITY_DN65491_c0_g1_i2.p1  ORF type:complete len:785 (-),score=204.86 TRINITY_DN65491_c0_g1_i2:43-2397(-)
MQKDNAVDDAEPEAAIAASEAHFIEPCMRALEYSLEHHLNDQAIFFGDRLLAELPAGDERIDEALRLLVMANLRIGDVPRAHGLLKERRPLQPPLRYLLALCCLRLDSLEDAERALLEPEKVSQAFSWDSILSFGKAPQQVAGGAAGLFLLGQIWERLQRPREQVLACYARCLEICPFMWCAYERLSWLSLGGGKAAAAKAASSSSAAGRDNAAQKVVSTLLAAGREASAFSRLHFSEEAFARDAVLHPPTERESVLRSASSSSTLQPRRLHFANAEAPAAPQKKDRKRPREPTTQEDALAFAESPLQARRIAGVGDTLISPCRFASPPSTSTDRGPLSDKGKRTSAANTPTATTPAAAQQVAAAAPSPNAQLVSPIGAHVQLLQKFSPRKLLSPLLARLGQQSSPLRRSASEFFEKSQEHMKSSSSSQAFLRRAKSADARLQGGEKCSLTASAAASAEKEELSLASLLRGIARGLHALNRYDCKAGLQALQALPRQQRGTAFVRQLEARCHFELTNYRQAADIYAKLCDAGKLHYRTVGLEYYSTALWHLRERMTLGHLAQQVLEWDRMQPQVWCVVGNCFSLQQDHEQAKKCFRRAVQLDPSFAYAHTLMAHECVASENFDKAIQLYQRAINLDPRHYNAWWGLGNVYYRQEEYARAKVHFRQALSINGSSAVMLISLGMVCQSLGDLQGALSELTRAQRLAPREASIQLQLGRAHAGQGNKQRALMHYTMAMDLCGADNLRERQAVMSAQAELQSASSGLPVVAQQGSSQVRVASAPRRPA